MGPMLDIAGGILIAAAIIGLFALGFAWVGDRDSKSDAGAWGLTIAAAALGVALVCYRAIWGHG